MSHHTNTTYSKVQKDIIKIVIKIAPNSLARNGGEEERDGEGGIWTNLRG